MKIILVMMCSLVSFTSFSQVLNGSFENGSAPDLSHWEWTCGAQSINNAPVGGGNYCIKVNGGNTQSCFPGYAFQKLPSIVNGQTFILSGWAFAQTSPTVGIYFGKINNGIITLQAGSITASVSWIKLSVQSSFTLLTGDTAVVVLHGGLTGGPVQGYGYFDLIDLQLVTGIYSNDQKQSLKLSPNPFSLQTTFHSDNILKDATLTLSNLQGQIIKQIVHISGQMINFNRDNLPCGIYFIRLTQDEKIITEGKIIIND